jgi:exonuclease I
METDYTVLAERTKQRLDRVQQALDYVEMVEKELTKLTFHFRARQFVNSLIRQRQLIINRGASHKNNYEMLKAIDHLRVNLDATSSKDQTMARYFLINEEQIRSLIPGSYPNKQYTKFISLRNDARDIVNHQLSIS